MVEYTVSAKKKEKGGMGGALVIQPTILYWGWGHRSYSCLKPPSVSSTLWSASTFHLVSVKAGLILHNLTSSMRNLISFFCCYDKMPWQNGHIVLIKTNPIGMLRDVISLVILHPVKSTILTITSQMPVTS